MKKLVLELIKALEINKYILNLNVGKELFDRLIYSKNSLE